MKKDAGMLDAFGKGASSDIQLAKQELYAQAGSAAVLLLSSAPSVPLCACLQVPWVAALLCAPPAHRL